MAVSAREFGRSWEWRVAARVAARRKALGLTQQHVADRMTARGIRTILQQVSQIEQGTGVGVGKLVVLAQALECSMTYLLDLTDKPDKWTPDTPLSELDTPPYRDGKDAVMLGRHLIAVKDIEPKALSPRRVAPQPTRGRPSGGAREPFPAGRR
jgi:transcriptional regulator with XRE-family HTH domain